MYKLIFIAIAVMIYAASNAQATKPVLNGQQSQQKLLSEKDTTLKPLIVIDGVLQKQMDINSIDPQMIASVSVFKADQAIRLYGTDAVNGVIVIVTKKKAISIAKLPNLLPNMAFKVQ